MANLGTYATSGLYTATGLTNTGKITLSPISGANHSHSYVIGGCIGQSKNYAVSEAYNKTSTSGKKPNIDYSGNVVFDDFVNSSDPGNGAIRIGGVIGIARTGITGANLTECHNEGDIIFNAYGGPSIHNFNWGGVVGGINQADNSEKVAIHVSNCSNKGDWATCSYR